MSTLFAQVRASPGVATNATAVIEVAMSDAELASPTRLSYSQLVALVEALRATLAARGAAKGTSVCVVLPNGIPFLVAFLAVAASGATVAPLNSAYKKDEFVFFLGDIKPVAVLAGAAAAADDALRQAAAELGVPVWSVAPASGGPEYALTLDGAPTGGDAAASEPAADDIALSLHTSGTTSRPKQVPLTHANLVASVGNIAAHYELTPSDVSLIVMPLFHVHGLLGATLSTLSSGGTVVLQERFSATSFWPIVRKFGVTWYSAVPTIHQILLGRADADHAPAEASTLRFIRSCSSSLAPATLEQLEARFHAPVLEAYGMTEAAHQMTSNPLPKNGPHKAGTVGQGTNVEVAIIDDEGKHVPTGTVSEVCIRGRNVTHGYANNPEANKTAFTADGWFRTGDQGSLDAEGFLTLTGRLKELINRGGEKISPVEVDAVLLEHPAVAEAVSFGAADAKYGEIVAAAVVLRAGEKRDEAELKASITAHCTARMAAFKVPALLFFADSLPRTATGKIQRRFVAEHFLQKK